MMGNAIKNIMLRAINKRLAAGEKLEDIIKSYPRLSNSDIAELEKEIKKTE